MEAIKINDFWLVEHGKVFKVTKLPAPDNDSYIGNRVSMDGLVKEVGVSPNNFERKITSVEAKKKALEIMAIKIEDLFI